MADPGLTATGFRARTFEEFLAEVEQAQIASPMIGPTQDYSADGALGQINRRFCEAMAEISELIEEVYSSGDPDKALGQALIALASLTGTTPRPAEATRIETAVVNLDAGTLLAAGSQAAVDGRPDLLFELEADVENTGGVAADFDAIFVATVTGPIVVNAATLTAIVTPVTGWNSVTNTEDGDTGRNADSPIELRERRQAQLALRGGSTVRAIRADLLDAEATPELAGIESVFVLENTGDTVNADGLPPHSFEAVIDDDGGNVDDDVIAQVIFDAKPAGIQAFGLESGVAADEYGEEYSVGFSRVVQLEVYVDLTLVTNADYPTDGDDLVAAAIVAEGDTLRAGQDAIALTIRSAALTVPGVVDVPTFFMGLAVSPTEIVNLDVSVRERAIFDTSRVTVL